MIAIGLLFVRMLRDYFKSRPQLEAEIVILRHQLNLLQRRASSGSATLSRIRSLADYTIAMLESSFRKRQRR